MRPRLNLTDCDCTFCRQPGTEEVCSSVHHLPCLVGGSRCWWSPWQWSVHSCAWCESVVGSRTPTRVRYRPCRRHYRLRYNCSYMYMHLYILERCNPWPHVANRHISITTTTTTTTVLRPFVRDYLPYLGEPVPEETLTHPPSIRHISISQLLSLWRHSHYDVIRASRQLSRPSEWRHKENDVITITAGLWRYADWRHVATGFNALVHIPSSGRLCFRRCLFVCLSVCFSVRDFAQNLSNGFAWNFQGMLAMDQWIKQTIKFWWRSRSPSWCRDCFPDSSLLGDTESGINRLSPSRWWCLPHHSNYDVITSPA